LIGIAEGKVSGQIAVARMRVAVIRRAPAEFPAANRASTNIVV
jgi:hypothetical protein